MHCFYFFGNFKRFAHRRTLAFVIVKVAIIAGGLTGPSTPDYFYPNLMSKKLEHEFEILFSSLKSGDASNQELSIPALAERIAKTLHVKSDEVAILAVSIQYLGAGRAHGTRQSPGNRQ